MSRHSVGVPTSDTDKSRAKFKRSSDDDHHWSNEEPDWNKAASLKRYSIGALGLAGRYLGGQATHQGQRFWARGEDPDQFAGWFGQSK